MSGGVKAAMGEVALPCAAMVVVEGCIIALTIMASTAMARGMTPFVFVVYTNALGSILLLPYLFLHDRNRSEGALLTFPFLVRVFVLGLIGVTIAQNLAFVGLSYSSPIVACGMANQLPALSFILAIILRTTKPNWRSSGTQARIIGTLISFMGAVSLSLYKGPTVKHHSSPSLAFPAAAPPPPSLPRLLAFTSTHENWVLGCALFAASSFTLATWNIFQAETVKMCPQVMKITSLYGLFGTIQTTLLALYLERDPKSWKLELNFELLVIVLTAIFSSLIRSNMQIWCTRLKGPLFVPIFKPFGIAYASSFGSLLFPYTFHYGSMIAAFICGVGYYTVFWGQIKDSQNQKPKPNGTINKNVVSSEDGNKVPLLQEEDSQV